MNTPSPQTKSSEILEKLSLNWYGQKKFTEFECKLLEREIASIPYDYEKYNLLGVLYAIQNNKEKMINNFELSLRSKFDIYTVANYATALSNYGLFSELTDLLYYYKDALDSPDLLKSLCDVASFNLDIDMLYFVEKKAIGIKSSDFMIKSISLRITQVLKILELTKCTKVHISSLLNVCSKVIQKYKQRLSTFSIELIADGHLVFGVETGDPEVIVDMNFELANEIASNLELDDCKLIIMFSFTRKTKK